MSIDFGYGYSAGLGAGYETGDGLRGDVTVDYLHNDGMSAQHHRRAHAGREYSLDLRSTIALANVYYDFGLGDLGLSAAGGAFGYVGAGRGVAFNGSVRSSHLPVPMGHGDRTPRWPRPRWLASGMILACGRRSRLSWALHQSYRKHDGTVPVFGQRRLHPRSACFGALPVLGSSMRFRTEKVGSTFSGSVSDLSSSVTLSLKRRPSGRRFALAVGPRVKPEGDETGWGGC